MAAPRCGGHGRSRHGSRKACLLCAVGFVCIVSTRLFAPLFAAWRLPHHTPREGYSRLLQRQALPGQDVEPRPTLAEEEKRAEVVVNTVPKAATEESSRGLEEAGPDPGATPVDTDASDDVDEEAEVDLIRAEELEVGQKYKATVLSVKNYGAFVEFGAEVNALVTRECMVEGDPGVFPQDILQEGQEVDIWINDILSDNKVSASLVEGLKRAPTKAELAQTLEAEPDKWWTAKVVRLRPSFADINVNIIGDHQTAASVHISQVSEDFVDRIEDVVQEGDEIQVKFYRLTHKGYLDFTMLETPRRPLRSFDGRDQQSSRPRSRPDFQPQNERSFSRAPPPRPPRDSASVESFAGLTDMWFDGTVTGIQPFGAFVDIEHPETGERATGLVHVSQIDNDYVEHPSAHVQMGDKVQCWILEVGNGKIGLSMRTE